MKYKLIIEDMDSKYKKLVVKLKNKEISSPFFNEESLVSLEFALTSLINSINDLSYDDRTTT